MVKINIFNPTSDHLELRKAIRRFSKEEIFPTSMDRDRREYFDRSLFDKMGKLGILGITVPTCYGGVDMDTSASVIAHEEIASYDPSIALAYLAHSILCIHNISSNGSQNIKQRLLPDLCSGKHIGCMALSESEAGSDIMSMSTIAEKVENGFKINGNKMWITNGVTDNLSKTADVIYLYAKMKSTNMISTFVVEGSAKAGQKVKNKLGMRGSYTSEIVFENSFVPFNNVISEKSCLKNMMRNLQIERLTLAAISLGIAKYTLNSMISYSKERKTFNKCIHNYGQIQQHIADSYSEYMACKSYVYNVAYSMSNEDYNIRIDTDSTKLITSKLAKNISDRAIQVLGGNGYIGEYHVERFWRDSKLLEIGGGTNEILQKNITKDIVKFGKTL